MGAALSFWFCSRSPPPPSATSYSSLSNAYQAALEAVWAQPVQDSIINPDLAKNQPGGFALNRRPYREVLNWSVTIDSPDENDRIFTNCPQRNTVIKNYFEKEAELFDSGDCKALTKLSKVWDAIKDPDTGLVHSNYGYMVHHLKDIGSCSGGSDAKGCDKPTTAWEWAKQRLLLCKDSNQAVLLFLCPFHKYETNLDQPCTTNVQFIIRDSELHMFATMRSNDVVYGTPYNWIYFTRMMHRMVRELSVHYPGLRVGKLVHRAASLHMYEHHVGDVERMLGSASAARSDRRGFEITSLGL